MSQNAVLLISDIVDSTHLAATLGAEAHAALFEAHDEIVRTLASIHRGREVNRSDGVLMRFRSVTCASEFAMAYHAALTKIGDALQVRIGIHAGPLDLRSLDESRASLSGVKAGVTVPMTARIAGLASGRQTLVSDRARSELDSARCRVVSHGHWRLKGIADPIELFEVGAADASFSPPADATKAYRVVERHGLWLPRRDIPHNLPAERDRFIGRDDELNAIASLIETDARCITIVGPGGVGKTRLAQRFAWQWLGEFEGGVWYCDLAQATTCDGLVSAAAQGLGLHLDSSSPIEQIASALRHRGSCMVILDNFEQITRFARDTLGHWLDGAASTRFIVTSRTVLGLAGETVHRLNSMEQRQSADLFVERALAANSDVAAESPRKDAWALLRQGFERDAETVASLVRLLDGNPLAIELAAARLRIMDLKTLLSRMRERFKLLSRGTGRVARHATLRATLDWSWDLLTAYEQSALAQASVFEGGFDLLSFEHVVELDRYPDAPSSMDVLQSLVEKSLIQQLKANRFGLLISVHEYAAERLATNAEVGGAPVHRAARHRHARYYAMLDEDTATIGRCVEIDNLVAAVRTAIELEDEDIASRVLINCWAALKQCGPYRTGEALAIEVLDMPSLSARSEARVCFVRGSALHDMGHIDAANVAFALGLEATRRGEAKFEEIWILRARGELEFGAGRHDEAAVTLNEALACARAINDDLLQCIALNALGTLRQSRGDNQGALERYGAALALAEHGGHQRWVGALMGNMGIALYGLNDRVAAQSHYVRALEIGEQFGDSRWIGNTRSNLGLVLADQGFHDVALIELEAALKIARQLGHLRLECIVIWNIGITRAAQSRVPEALVHFHEAREMAIKLGDHGAREMLDRQIEETRKMAASITQ